VRPQELSPQGQKLEAAIRAGAQAVLNLKDALNEWDGLVGDGDCGTTVIFFTILNWHDPCVHGYEHVSLFQR